MWAALIPQKGVGVISQLRRLFMDACIRSRVTCSMAANAAMQQVLLEPKHAKFAATLSPMGFDCVPLLDNTPSAHPTAPDHRSGRCSGSDV